MSKRDEIVRLVAKKKNLKKKSSNIFCLTHEADEMSKQYWVSAPYTVNVFDVMVAYIQFEANEIEQVYGIDQEDIIKVLEEFYDCKQIDEPNSGIYTEIDLYNNWEFYCGICNQIQNIESLKREGLPEKLKELVEDFYQAFPEWRPKEVAK